MWVNLLITKGGLRLESSDWLTFLTVVNCASSRRMSCACTTSLADILAMTTGMRDSSAVAVAKSNCISDTLEATPSFR